MQKLPTLPGFSDPVIRETTSGSIFQDPHYAFFKQLYAVVVEQREQIETLREALNEVRASPVTVFPPVDPF